MKGGRDLRFATPSPGLFPLDGASTSYYDKDASSFLKRGMQETGMANAPRGHRALWRRLWNFLASRQVAVVLLLVVLLLLLAGLAIPQRPAELYAADLKAWQGAMQERYGPAWETYEALGLTDLFHTPLFWGLAAALFLNTLACTLDRLGRLLRAIRRPPVLRLPEAAYVPAGRGDETPPRSYSLQEARRHLRRWGYRLWEEPGRPHYFYGETPRLAPVGTLLSHLGLFLLVPALLLQPLAWRERLVLDAGASSIALTHHPACTVAALGLQVEESGGFLRRISGELLVHERETAIQGRTGPEGPLSACGVNFYLRSYGLALQVEAADRGGRPLDVVPSEEGRAASSPPPGKILPRYPGASSQPAGPAILRFPAGATERSFDIPSLALHVTVAPSATALTGFREGLLQVHIEQAGLNRPLFDGRIAANTTLELPAGRLSFRPASFLEVEAVYDPGFPLLLSAGSLLVLGSSLALLCPRRYFWARLDEDGTLWVRFGRGEDSSGGTM